MMSEETEVLKPVVGTMTTWFAAKGFGFALAEVPGGFVKYFIHVSNVVSGVPEQGRKVRFVPTMAGKGPLALHVQVITEAEALVHELTAKAGQ
jgi:cold shock CspA family protein